MATTDASVESSPESPSLHYQVQVVVGVPESERTWRLVIEEDRVTFSPTVGLVPPIVVPFSSAREKMRLIARDLVAFKPDVSPTGRMLGIRLDAEAIEAVERWLAPLTDEYVAHALRQSAVVFVGFGAFLTFVSLPLEFRKPPTFEPAILAVAVVLVGLGLLARFRPAPILLLIHAIFDLLLMAASVAASTQSWRTGFFAIAYLFFGLIALREYRRYSRMAGYLKEAAPG